MKVDCREVEARWQDYKIGRCLSPEQIQSVEAHVRSCPKCRALAFEKGLAGLLKLAGCAPAPGPSEWFHARLAAELDEQAPQGGSSLFADCLARAGLRLVPVLAGLLMALTLSAAYLSRNDSSAIVDTSAEEVILFEASPVSSEVVLAALTGNEV